MKYQNMVEIRNFLIENTQIRKQITLYYINQEMFRNQSMHKQHRQSLSSQQTIIAPPFSVNNNHNNNHNQSSQLLLMRPVQCEHVPLQKTRTFSHKKLTLTSTMPSPMNSMNNNMNNTNNERRTINSNGGNMTYNLDTSKFYRPPQPHSIKPSQNMNTMPISYNNNNSKKVNIAQQSKVSLKLSVAVSDFNANLNINSPDKSKSNHNISINSQSVIASVDYEQLRAELKQCLAHKVQGLQQKITAQCQQIQSLQHKIHALQAQLQQKSSIIASLTQKSCKVNQAQQSPAHMSSSSIVTRIGDIQKILKLISSQSQTVQQKINNKLDRLTRQLVQMNINKKPQVKPNLYNNLQQTINKTIIKIQKQLSQKQAKQTQLQSKLLSFQQKYSKISTNMQEIVQNFRFIDYKVSTIQSHMALIKTQRQKYKQKQDSFYNMKTAHTITKANTNSTDTKDSINYWQTFQDYVLTNRSQNQLKNVSIFAHDDYFFHPDSRAPVTTNNNDGRNSNKDMHCSIALIPSTYSSVLPHFIYHTSQMASASALIAHSNTINNTSINSNNQGSGSHSPQYYGTRLTSFSDIANPVVNCHSPTQPVQSNSKTNINLRSSSNTNNNSSTCIQPSLPLTPLTATPTSLSSQSSSSSSSLQTILSIMQQLKQYYSQQLPIRCKLDKHGRILMLNYNRLLQDTTTHQYFKISNQQGNILFNRGYLNIINNNNNNNNK